MAYERRPDRTLRNSLIIAGGMCFAAVVAIFVVSHWPASGRPNGKGNQSPSIEGSLFSGGPSPAREGDTWTHRELIAHLKARGLPLISRVATIGGAHGPAMWVAKQSGNAIRDDKMYLEMGAGDSSPPVVLDGVVYVQKMKAADSARDEAGTTTSGFSWGRFLFLGDSDLLREIRKRLS